MLSSKTNALLTHTLASFWRKQSCFYYPYGYCGPCLGATSVVTVHNKRHINLLESGLRTLVFANHHRYLKYARRIRAVYHV